MRSHTSNIVPESLAELNPQSSGFLSSLQISHLRHGPNVAPLQKSHRNYRPYVWTETLSGMISVSAQKLSGIRYSVIIALQ